MEDLVTIESILQWFKKQIESKEPITPAKWLESAAKLNVLLEDLDNELAFLEGEMATYKAQLISKGDSVSKADALKVGKVDYSEYLRKKKMAIRVIEHIRIAKKRTETNIY